MYLLFTAGADRIFSFCSALADLCLAKSNPNILHFVLLCSMALLRHASRFSSLFLAMTLPPVIANGRVGMWAGVKQSQA